MQQRDTCGLFGENELFCLCNCPWYTEQGFHKDLGMAMTLIIIIVQMMDIPQTPQNLEQTASAPVLESTTSSIASLSALELVEHLAVLLESNDLPERKEVDQIKALFYRRKTQAEQADDTAIIEQITLQEERMSDLLTQYREQDKKRQQLLEEQYTTNRAKAEDVISRLEALLESDKEFQTVYTEFHALRTEWEAARPLSQQDESRLRKLYATLRDRFYELKNINEELREYDFRKNLELKQALITELTELDKHPDPIYAVRQMTAIASRWHDLGPVGRDHRAEIHGRYKELSHAIFSRHQAYQDEKRSAEQANLELKQALVTRLEERLACDMPERRKDWETLTEEIKAMQAEWRTIGYSGRKESDQLYARLRAGIDAFFMLKKEYYQRSRSEEVANLERKQELVERAKELSQSTDWEATAKALQDLQRQWKEIGPVPERHSQGLYNKFRESLDYFFDQRKAMGADKRSHERDNLKAKETLLEELRTLQASSDNTNLKTTLREIQQRWQQVGHVPHAEKDRINSAYKALQDELYGRLRGARSERRLSGYSDKVQSLSGDKQALSTERQKMERVRERLRAELRAYETNINFLTLSSKGANSLLRDVERKQAELVEELRLLDEKIALLAKS